jgi:hypothetical protein
VTDVRNPSNYSKETDCESEGAFTPTNCPCNRMLEDRPGVHDFGEGGHKEQIPYTR